MASLFCLFTGKKMHKHRKIKKSHYTKLKAKNLCQTRKKNKKTKNFDSLPIISKDNFSLSILESQKTAYSEDQLSEEQFDRAACDAMLEMVGMNADYYYQISKY